MREGGWTQLCGRGSGVAPGKLQLPACPGAPCAPLRSLMCSSRLLLLPIGRRSRRSLESSPAIGCEAASTGVRPAGWGVWAQNGGGRSGGPVPEHHEPQQGPLGPAHLRHQVAGEGLSCPHLATPPLQGPPLGTPQLQCPSPLGHPAIAGPLLPLPPPIVPSQGVRGTWGARRARPPGALSARQERRRPGGGCSISRGARP